MTIKTLARKGVSNREVAHLLGVRKSSVRYQLKQMKTGIGDGRSNRNGLAADFSQAIDYPSHTAQSITIISS